MRPANLELHLGVDEAVCLEHALAAFDRLIAGAAPDPAEFAAAPILGDWHRAIVPAPEPVLVGQVACHPRLPGARRVVTSRLLLLDETAGWARTVNRLYRLKTPPR